MEQIFHVNATRIDSMRASKTQKGPKKLFLAVLGISGPLGANLSAGAIQDTFFGQIDHRPFWQLGSFLVKKIVEDLKIQNSCFVKKYGEHLNK